MGHEIRSLCQADTRRLICLIGALFAVIVVFQYLELPYGNVLSSLFPVGKDVGKSSNQTGDSLLEFETQIIGNITRSNGLNYTDTFPVHEVGNNTEVTEGKDRTPNNDFVSDGSRGSNKSFELEEDKDAEHGYSLKNSVGLNKTSMIDNVKESNNVFALERASEPAHSFSLTNVTVDNESSIGDIWNEDAVLPSENSRSSNTGFASLAPGLPPVVSPSNIIPPTNMDTNSRTPISVNSNSSLEDNDVKNSKPLSSDNSSMTSGSLVKERSEIPMSAVVSISEMNDLLTHSRTSSHFMKPRWSSAADQELLYAKSQIENAPIIKKDSTLYGPIYRNISMFKRSYELMEQTLKVYIYEEGKKPVFHQPVLTGIYASEGWFMKLLEADKRFVTRDSRKAHLFYLPFSSRMLEEALYVPNSHSHKNLIQYLKNYLELIVEKYPFWNRTGGADHFLVACHDWAPSETKQYMATCIRALCNADPREGFIFGKDVSLPETYVRSAKKLLKDLGGKRPSRRPILAFFAGNMHGYVRPILLQYWENKDPDMKIFGRMPRSKNNRNYIQNMKSSKYCICAKGYEVNSPRVVEAIFYECVPVIISDNFVPPFFEILNWESFAVFVMEKDIPNLKDILLSISEKRYQEMQRRVKKVQQHFLWHAKPEEYDIFHMILHSIWYNRVFQVRSRR